MFSNPQHNIEQFALGDDMRVADFGTGSGAYALAAARAVGADGKVYAIDVRQEKLGGSGLRDGAVDAVVASNILFQLKDKKTFFKEAKRVLASGGRLLLVDWAQSFGGAGPEASAVVREDEAKTLALDEGFTYIKSIDAGAYHYGLVFKKE